jgi:hypothetical protein
VGEHETEDEEREYNRSALINLIISITPEINKIGEQRNDPNNPVTQSPESKLH